MGNMCDNFHSKGVVKVKIAQMNLGFISRSDTSSRTNFLRFQDLPHILPYNRTIRHDSVDIAIFLIAYGAGINLSITTN